MLMVLLSFQTENCIKKNLILKKYPHRLFLFRKIAAAWAAITEILYFTVESTTPHNAATTTIPVVVIICLKV